MKKPIHTKTIVAGNVQFLMELSNATSHRHVSHLTGVSPGVIDNLFIADRPPPTLATIERLARGFRVDPWMLLFPNLKAVMGRRAHLQKLIQRYASADETGQRLIDEVAEGGRAFLWAAQTEVQLPAQAWTTYGPTSALTTVSGGQTIRGQCIVTLFTRWNPARNAWIVERYRYSGC